MDDCFCKFKLTLAYQFNDLTSAWSDTSLQRAIATIYTDEKSQQHDINLSICNPFLGQY
jgi:hypothetical protein